MKISEERLLVVGVVALLTMAVGLGTHDLYGDLWMAVRNASVFLVSAVVGVAVYRRSSAIMRVLENLSDDAVAVHLIVTVLLMAMMGITATYGVGIGGKFFLPAFMLGTWAFLVLAERHQHVAA